MQMHTATCKGMMGTSTNTRSSMHSAVERQSPTLCSHCVKRPLYAVLFVPCMPSSTGQVEVMLPGIMQTTVHTRACIDRIMPCDVQPQCHIHYIHICMWRSAVLPHDAHGCVASTAWSQHDMSLLNTLTEAFIAAEKLSIRAELCPMHEYWLMSSGPACSAEHW